MLVLLFSLACSAPQGVDKVQELAAPARATAITLAPHVGLRVQRARELVLEIPEDELLRPFEHRPGAARLGAHAGQWLVAAAALREGVDDAQLAAKARAITRRLIATQEEDGYLGTYAKEKRFSRSPDADADVWVHARVLRGLLCMHERERDPEVLRAATRIGALLCATFAEGKRDILSAGTQQGMSATAVLAGIVQLWRATGDAQLLVLARTIVRSYEREGGPDLVRRLLVQTPVHRLADARASEMLENLVGLAELYRATGERDLMRATMAAWSDIRARRLHVTGSGSAHGLWQADGVLPIAAADEPCETCVTVAWLQLNAQLARLTGEARFSDEIERTAFNQLFAAQDPRGTRWCRFTPLHGEKAYASGATCCRASGLVGIAQLPQLAVQRTEQGVLVNLLVFRDLAVPLRGGTLALRCASSWPLQGAVALTVTQAPNEACEIAVRVPACVRVRACTVAREDTRAVPGAILRARRTWQAGDTIELDLDPVVERIEGSAFGLPHRIAYSRGPLVLASDTPGAAALAVINAELKVPLAGERSDRFGGFIAAPVRPLGSDVTLHPLLLTDFARAGANGEPLVVWFRTHREDGDPTLSSLAFGQQTCSRAGEPRGSICDADKRTFCVTRGDARPEADWFALAGPAPVDVARVVFTHGRTLRSGGWFDAAGGAPRVELRVDGVWREVGVLSEYPATTASDAKGLEGGESFTLRIAATKASGVRVLGRGASGDDGAQRSASCGELEVFAR